MGKDKGHNPKTSARVKKFLRVVEHGEFKKRNSLFTRLKEAIREPLRCGKNVRETEKSCFLFSFDCPLAWGANKKPSMFKENGAGSKRKRLKKKKGAFAADTGKKPPFIGKKIRTQRKKRGGAIITRREKGTCLLEKRILPILGRKKERTMERGEKGKHLCDLLGGKKRRIPCPHPKECEKKGK